MTGRVGVAISTTGDEHRIELLRQCVAAWDRCLPAEASLFVTVDGSVEDAERVRQAVYDWTESVYRVGQPTVRFLDTGQTFEMNIRHMDGAPVRRGVATNKNTGIELLMDNTSVEHLFLSDDDTWPLYPQALTKHTENPIPHTMVCWGGHRLEFRVDTNGYHLGYATWTWPRGVMLYLHRGVVEAVGGMDERFGAGGHEHVEYSRRIFNAGLTPAPYCSPASYAERGIEGIAHRASALWHCEDMRRPGETLGGLRLRRRHLTSVRRDDEDWPRIEALMAETEHSLDFVPYQARANRRASATLCVTTPSRGAGDNS